MGGYYLTNNNDGKEYVYLNRYLGNHEQKANMDMDFRHSNMPNLSLDEVHVKVHWHTHLSKFPDPDRLKPSKFGGNGGDRGGKKRALVDYPHMKFYIFTNPKRKEY